MIKVSSSLPDITVLRGGTVNYKQSLTEGVEVLTSLTKIGYDPVDVIIGRDGEWTSKGYPTDAHDIFTKAHTVVDTTRMEGQAYQVLAKKMHIPLIFGKDTEIKMDREDLYRILRQQGIQVPDTLVVRSSATLTPSIFRDIWLQFHTPILIRPLTRHGEAPPVIIRIFHELEQVLRDYHEKGIDTHILTYRKKPTTSIAVVPHFRHEEIYTPLWVDTFPEEGELPHKGSTIRPHLQPLEWRREHIQSVTKKVYKALGLNTPVCIDYIHHNDDYIVVNVELAPSLHKDGRFMKSLATTGVDAGHYIHEYISHDIQG